MSGKIAVFIDTSVYVSYKFDFDTRNLVLLNRLAQNGAIKLVTTTITVEETKKRALSELESFCSALGKLLRELKVPAWLGEEYSGLKNISAAKLKESITESIDWHFNWSRYDILEVDNVEIGEIFNKYFNKLPPFSASKKNEFPDAFVLHRLEKLFEEGCSKVCIVSKDNDFKNYCNGSELLDCFDDISGVLDQLSREDLLYNEVCFFIEDHGGEILDVFKNNAEGLTYYLHDRDGKVESSLVEEIYIDEYDVVAIGNEKAMVDFFVGIKASVWVSYDDPDKGYYDKEEGEWVSFGDKLEKKVQVDFKQNLQGEFIVGKNRKIIGFKVLNAFESEIPVHIDD